MNKPLVSVIIETINAREAGATTPLADALAVPLGALDRQTYPQELIERIVVIDGGVAEAEAAELRRRYPAVKLVSSPASNYFAAKNAGAAAASGDIVAMLDSDCEAVPEWLGSLVARLDSGAAAVAGHTRYAGGSWAAQTFSVPDFAYAYIRAGGEGAAAGFNLSNVAFRREVFLTHPLETRIRRNGGCYFLYHQLRAEGARVLYEPRAVVAHGLYVGRLGFVRKHFDRGYDGVEIYRLDDRAVLRGSRLYRRFGAVALVAITARRVAVDWLRLARHRREIGIPFLALPYFAALTVLTRTIELAGGLAASFTPGPTR